MLSPLQSLNLLQVWLADAVHTSQPSLHAMQKWSVFQSMDEYSLARAVLMFQGASGQLLASQHGYQHVSDIGAMHVSTKEAKL